MTKEDFVKMIEDCDEAEIEAAVDTAVQQPYDGYIIIVKNTFKNKNEVEGKVYM